MASQSASVCPVCGRSDAIRKVSAVSRDSQLSTPSLAGQLEFPKQTIQSELLRIYPDIKPKLTCLEKTIDYTLALGGLVSLLLAIEVGVGIVVVYLVFAVILYVVLKKMGVLRGSTDAESENWKQALSRRKKAGDALAQWEKLYYCIRDDCVFDPESGISAPPNRMKDLLL